MKKLTVIIAILTITFSSCRTYEEGKTEGFEEGYDEKNLTNKNNSIVPADQSSLFIEGLTSAIFLTGEQADQDFTKFYY